MLRAPLCVALLVLALPTPPLSAFQTKGPQNRGQVPPLPEDVGPVQTTPKGLQFSVLKAGPPGETPRWGDKVKVHYTGWHLDRSVFASSRPQTAPAEFRIGDVIDGWSEALMMMTPGSHWKLTVPPGIGYGARGNPPAIKPDETLIFEIEFISFERGPELPRFNAGNPANQQKTEAGLVWEALRAGTGVVPTEEQIVELSFALFTQEGRLLDCSEKQNGFRFKGRPQDFPYRVMQIACKYMKEGGRYRFVVPQDLCPNLPFYGAAFLPHGMPTIWELELHAVKDVKLPPFVKPDPAAQKSTGSGLKYEVLAAGEGASPRFGDKLQVQYAGWLTDGTLFDSSHLRGEPYGFRFGPTGLIQGWIEGLQLMKPGARFRFEIPGKLGYGPRGSPPKIPADATLVFELELVKIGE